MMIICSLFLQLYIFPIGPKLLKHPNYVPSEKVFAALRFMMFSICIYP